MSDVASIDLVLELETDVSLRESNRTLGSVGTLTWLPGRVLWGAAASAAYQAGMTEAEAFDLFHRGQIRFRDAVPLAGEARTYPVPRSWHVPKGSEAREQVRNLAASQADGGTQWQPVQDGWLTADGTLVTVPTVVSMRTALDRSGRAQEGLLHTLPVIRAGSRFWTTISGPREAVERVVDQMEADGLSLGKSKNSELGRVKVQRAARPAEYLSSHLDPSAGSLSFLCVSRLVLRHPDTGAPTLVPDPRYFGLDPTWEFVPERSFLRSVLVVHFHAKRARPETERLALERGSVVTFIGEAARLDRARLVAVAESGVGEWRNQGYGEVLVNPSWLSEPVAKVFGEPQPRTSALTASEPDDELFGWARQHAQAVAARLEVFERATALARTLEGKAIPPAQWGVLHQKARRARIEGQSAEALIEDLKAHFGSGRRHVAEAWTSGARDSVLAAVRREEALAAVFLEQLANAGMRGKRSLEEEARTR